MIPGGQTINWNLKKKKEEIFEIRVAEIFPKIVITEQKKPQNNKHSNMPFLR